MKKLLLSLAMAFTLTSHGYPALNFTTDAGLNALINSAIDRAILDPSTETMDKDLSRQLGMGLCTIIK